MEEGAEQPERPFAEASALERRAAGRFVGALSTDWYQGRAVYGGLSAAILVRAMQLEAGDGKPLRTLHTTFVAPAIAGEVAVEVEVVRAGRSVAFVRATMQQAGRAIAIGTATFARQRRSSVASHAPPPLRLPPVSEVSPGPKALYIPAFSRYFEFRQALGEPAFSGADEAHVGGWCRLRGGPVSGEAALAPLFIDSWAPAALSRHPTWVPCASVDLFLHVHDAFDGEEVDWLGYEARSDHVDSGYADERSALYSPDGRPLASARQLIAIFG